MFRILALSIILGLALVGCSFLAEEKATPTPPETIVIPTPELTPTLPSSVDPTAPESGSAPDSLNIWLAPGVSNDFDAPGGRILSEQIQAFSANHPDVQLNVALKQPSGSGGTLNYLRTGRTVAPSILPDLIALPAEQLPTAVADELIYPLDQLLSEELTGDLFPAAKTLSQVDGVTYGYPAALKGLDHLVYDTTVITGTLPLQWEEMIALEDASLAIAGAGTPGGKLALQFYVSAGGRLSDEGELPSLDPEILTNSLSQISRARLEGMISPDSNGFTTLGETWTAFTDGASSATITEAEQYLSILESESDFTFAQIPGIERPLTPLIKGWVWAVSTPDPARQALAAEMISWLAAGPNMGEWTLSAFLLPVRRSGFEQWPMEGDYVQFLQSELERSNLLPSTIDDRVLTTLSTAVFDILSLAKTPQAAAGEVIADLQP